MYNNYEEYMRSVLGYSMPNTYMEADYYDNMRVNQNMTEVNNFYPEIYGIVYPVVQKVCSRRGFVNISEEQINEMVEEVYNVIEADEEETNTRENLKNGDVKNPRAKETRRPPRQNFLLKDLIRILIIRELLAGKPWGTPRNRTKTRNGRYEPNATNNETSETLECFRMTSPQLLGTSSLLTRIFCFSFSIITRIFLYILITLIHFYAF